MLFYCYSWVFQKIGRMCYFQVKKLSEEHIEQGPRNKDMFAHGIEGFLRVPPLQGCEQGLVRDERTGLGTARREVKAPEAEIVQ